MSTHLAERKNLTRRMHLERVYKNIRRSYLGQERFFGQSCPDFDKNQGNGREQRLETVVLAATISTLQQFNNSRDVNSFPL